MKLNVTEKIESKIIGPPPKKKKKDVVVKREGRGEQQENKVEKDRER